MTRAGVALAAVVALAGCAPFDGPPPASPTEAPVAFAAASYGSVTMRAAPGTACTIRILVQTALGDTPPPVLTGTADASGVIALEYPTPRVAGGTGTYTADCRTPSGAMMSASTDFAIVIRPISAAGFAVRAIAAPPPTQVAAASFTPEDPRLIPLRDRFVATLQRSLPSEWHDATRGLGSLRMVSSGADITIEVVAARATSVHLTATDGSQEIVLYVADDHGPIEIQNLETVALHELGHIWCCTGPGTKDGHWITPEVDPTLSGLDRFGLMNHPVVCEILQGGVVSCPNRFSVRELRQMGFTKIPGA